MLCAVLMQGSQDGAAGTTGGHHFSAGQCLESGFDGFTMRSLRPHDPVFVKCCVLSYQPAYLCD